MLFSYSVFYIKSESSTYHHPLKIPDEEIQVFRSALLVEDPGIQPRLGHAQRVELVRRDAADLLRRQAGLHHAADPQLVLRDGGIEFTQTYREVVVSTVQSLLQPVIVGRGGNGDAVVIETVHLRFRQIGHQQLAVPLPEAHLLVLARQHRSLRAHQRTAHRRETLVGRGQLRLQLGDAGLVAPPELLALTVAAEIIPDAGLLAADAPAHVE